MKTNREYKRRFPWFSASLGVIALASVATLFVSGQLNAGHGEFGLFVRQVFDRLTTAQAALGRDGLYEVSFADAGHEDGLVVSGYPSYASATLPLVRDQKTRALRLVLNGRQDVSNEAVTALRVTVNGRRVMERVLAPGQRDFNWVFDLTDQLDGSTEARVGVQLAGDVSAEVCHSDRSMGAVLSLDPNSGVEIELDGPLTSVRDVLALTPRHVVIALDDGDDWFEIATRLGARLNRNGFVVTMMDIADAPLAVEAGLEGVILAASRENLQRAGFQPVGDGAPAGASLWRRAGATMVAVTDPERIDTIRFLTSELSTIARGVSVDPVQFLSTQGPAVLTLEALGVDTSMQQVSDRREWRFDYELANAPHGRVADGVGLDFRLPDGPSGVTTVAHVALNGQLIDSRRLAGAGQVRYRVDLPAQGQGLTNEIAVALQRQRDDGGCEISQQRYPVQLSSDSALLFDGARNERGFTALPQSFANGLEVRLPDMMSAQQRLVMARVAAETLALFAPADTVLSYRFVPTDNGRSEPVGRPFLAINNAPANVQSPLRVYADRLVMQAGEGMDVDVRALSDLTLLQVSRAELSPAELNGAPVYVPGLVVHAIDDAPSMLGAYLGQGTTAIIHADGVAMTPGAQGAPNVLGFE
ncbi:hypothetical protein ACFELO_12370 [Oceanicaulis sp. LC35]|uniref:hypothetical protein n=1 Tax=Oceanicaulis sp. LC35 TaxID=3349635 RepID=UPI003F83012D